MEKQEKEMIITLARKIQAPKWKRDHKHTLTPTFSSHYQNVKFNLTREKCYAGWENIKLIAHQTKLILGEIIEHRKHPYHMNLNYEEDPASKLYFKIYKFYENIDEKESKSWLKKYELEEKRGRQEKLSILESALKNSK